MELSLPLPPAPEYMASHAADLTELVLRIDGIDLDFSIGSLQVVDELLGRFHDAGDDPDRMAETIFRFGAYVGEVSVRHAGGSWVTVPDDHPLGGGGLPLVQVADRLVNPIGKAFKRVRHGTPDSITYFYEALVAR